MNILSYEQYCADRINRYSLKINAAEADLQRVQQKLNENKGEIFQLIFNHYVGCAIPKEMLSHQLAFLENIVNRVQTSNEISGSSSGSEILAKLLPLGFHEQYGNAITEETLNIRHKISLETNEYLKTIEENFEGVNVVDTNHRENHDHFIERTMQKVDQLYEKFQSDFLKIGEIPHINRLLQRLKNELADLETVEAEQKETAEVDAIFVFHPSNVEVDPMLNEDEALVLVASSSNS